MTTRRQFMISVPAATAAFAVASHWLSGEAPARAQEAVSQPPLKGHFHPKGTVAAMSASDPKRTLASTLPNLVCRAEQIARVPRHLAN